MVMNRSLGTNEGFPASPTAGTAYQNLYGDATCTLSTTLNPGIATSASVTVEITDGLNPTTGVPDMANAVWVLAAKFGTPVGVTLASMLIAVPFRVPQNFYWRFSLTNATIGALTAWS